MFVSGWKWKTRKIIIPSIVTSYKSLVSVKENTDKKSKNNKKQKQKEKRKKEKNTDKTQAKLNTPCIMYNVKILPQ